jgi:hypothetical protein
MGRDDFEIVLVEGDELKCVHGTNIPIPKFARAGRP